jgi:hypothetical protein
MIEMPNSADITVFSVGFQPIRKFSGKNKRPL